MDEINNNLIWELEDRIKEELAERPCSQFEKEHIFKTLQVHKEDVLYKITEDEVKEALCRLCSSGYLEIITINNIDIYSITEGYRNYLAKKKVPPKQVIVIRKDLNMRKGKMIAQGAHASLKVLLDLDNSKSRNRLEIPLGKSLRKWVEGSFTKIVVGVDSESELLRIYGKAQKQGLLVSLIQDSGVTEFGGVPTYTAVAVGPDEAYKVDEITGDLKLL